MTTPTTATTCYTTQRSSNAACIAQAWGHNPGEKVLGAPQLYLFEPHQTEQMGWKPDVFLDITPVWDRKRAAIECMEGQEHLWEYYTRVAENRANHFTRNSGGQAGGRDGEVRRGLPVGLPAHRGRALMAGVVVQNIERADAETIAGLGAAGVATVHEAQGRTGLMRRLHAADLCRGADRRLGRDDLDAAGRQLDDPRRDRAAARGRHPRRRPRPAPARTAISATCSPPRPMARGCRGLVIDAGVRDVRDLTEMGFPVWSRAVSAQGTVKETLGSVNVPIVCAGALRPSRATSIVADDDGVCVVPRAEAAAALAAADKRLAAEEEKRQRLAAGELGLDIYGMREPLARLGLVYK